LKYFGKGNLEENFSHQRYFNAFWTYEQGGTALRNTMANVMRNAKRELTITIQSEFDAPPIKIIGKNKN
jgi:hypothetical protein